MQKLVHLKLLTMERSAVLTLWRLPPFAFHHLRVFEGIYVYNRWVTQPYLINGQLLSADLPRVGEFAKAALEFV